MEKENIWEWKRRGTEKGWRLVWEEKGRGKMDGGEGWKEREKEKGWGVEWKGKSKGLGSVREGKEKWIEEWKRWVRVGKGRVE